MTTPKPTKNSNSRRLWLGSSSVIAAAVAFTAASAPAYAQVSPGASASGIQVTAQDRFEAQRGGSRGVGRGGAQREIPVGMPNVRGNTMAVPSQTSAVIAPAPTIPSIRVNAAPPIVSFAASAAAPTMQAASGDAGINVRATAQFDTNQIEFNPGVASDQINVLSSSAIIDWNTLTAGAFGTQVTFLGENDNLNFTSLLADYTVLNRVTTPGFDSAIRIDGNVTSSTLGGNGSGGNIWFYSAGGIILGSTGSFNVGSLLLSTSEIDPADVNVGAFDVNFTGTPDSESFIRIENSATIRATNSDSYVAMVAPRIEQNGSVFVNGSVAYVAAEEAVMTIANGLFDIAVTVGTEDANGIVHGSDASTGGPGSTAITDEQGIYFVAVPKNEAITMLVSGDISYNATSALESNDGTIILTTGNRVEIEERGTFFEGSFVNVASNIVDTSIDGGPAGSILIENAVFNGNTTIFAEDTVTIQAGITSSNDAVVVDAIGDAGNLDVIAGNAVNFDITRDGAINVSGNLTATAGDGVGNGGTIVVNVDQIDAVAASNGGTLNVGNDLIFDARGQGLDDAEGVLNNGGQGIGGDGTAGNIAVQIADLGAVAVGGDLILDASANGGRGSVRQGEAFGGSASVSVTDGTLFVGGDFVLDASTRRAGTLVSQSLGIDDSMGGPSTSGSVSLNLDGGSANLQNVQLDASAQSSFGFDLGVAQSNDAFAGTAEITVSNGVLNINTLDIDVSADPSTSSNGTGQTLRGTAGRGRASISAFGSDTVLSVNGDVDIDASTGFSIVTTPVGDTVSIAAIDTGANGGIFFGGDLTIEANSNGGGRGVLTQAGTVRIEANNGNFSADGIDIFSDTESSFDRGPDDLRGTDFQGGDISIIASNNGSISSTGRSEISASATGLPDSEVTSAGIGQGGNITLLADDASISFANDLSMNASGFADGGVNANGVAGQGLGGTISVTVQGTSGNLSFADVSASTNGEIGEGDIELGPPPTPGSGSTGRGGLTQFSILGGTLTAQDLDLSSSGLGGDGGAFLDTASGLVISGDGGQGIGGDVTFTLDGGDATVRQLDVTAIGLGGFGGDGGDGGFFGGPAAINAGDGGSAVGGNATFNALAGTLTVTETLTVQATGNERLSNGLVSGGSGGDGFGTAAGDGGASEGGTATFNLNGTAVIDAAQLVVSTQAFGGDGGTSNADFFTGAPDQGGGDGGDAVGGTALFNDTAGDITFGDLTVNSSGTGGGGGESIGVTTGDAVGDGGNGGAGTGGSALISLNQDDTVAKNYSVISQGIGGEGGIGALGGAGGLGQGGIAELAVNDVSVVFDQLMIDAIAIGGDGGFIDGQLVVDGADGGDAEGGDARLFVAGANADFLARTVVTITAAATGGNGREGATNFSGTGASGNGGLGGNGTGGSATISVIDNAVVAIDSSALTLNSDSFGGTGGNGASNFNGGDAGDGGLGGDGTGGTVGIIAANGADVSVISPQNPFQLASTGTGGAGGIGGDSGDSLGGTGGDGGIGTGGSPLVSATGATITIGDLELLAQGQGAQGGQGGQTDIFGSVSVVINEPDGAGGAGNGGTPIIEALEGSPGILNLGDTLIDARGAGGTGLTTGIGNGGQVTIRDRSTDPAGLIGFGDLTIDASGDAVSTTGLITVTSDSGPITVDGDLVAVVVGDMDFSMTGDGQLLVTGAATLGATRDIDVSHANQAAGIASIDTGTTFNAIALASFNAVDAGDINSAQAVTITAENISYDNITSLSTVDLTATNGDITGTSTGTIIASAVNDAINLTATGNVTFGTLNNVDGDPTTRDGNIDVDAGGDIIGVSAISGQTINFDAPGLVMVGTVDTSATNVGTVTINAGTIELGTLNARFISNLTSDTGDIAIDTISGLTSVDLDSAADIIIGTADTSALSADALAGDISIGSLTTTGVSDVRLNAGGDISYTSIDGDRLVSLNSDTITGGDLVAEAQITLTAGSIDIGDTRSTGGNVLFTSTVGDIAAGAITSDVFGVVVDSAGAVNLGDITTGATTRVVSVGDTIVGDVDADGSTVINAGGNITAGDLFSGTNSPGMSITALGDADIASATANGGLTLNVDGALSGGDFVGQGPLSLVTINAGSVDIGSVDSINQSVTITTSGAAVIGSASSGVNTTITGASVNLDSGEVGNTLRVTSNTGDITGLGSITVGGLASFISAADIAIGTLEASTIALTSAGDLRFNGLISPNAITLSAVNGIIGATTPGEGDIDSGGAVDLVAEEIDLGDINSDGSITANASVGDASFGELTAGTFITINANGNPSVESVTSGGNVTLTGASVSLDGGDIGGGLVLNALAGDISLAFDGVQQLLVGDSATFLATGDMTVTHTNNAAGTVSIDAGSGISVNIGGSFNSGAGSIISSDGEQFFSVGGDITANDLRAVPGIDLTAGGNVLLNNATAIGPQGSSNFRGITVRAGFNVDPSGVPFFDNIANATITGDVTSYADITITAGGNAVFASGSNTAADNGLTVNTGDDIIVEAGAFLSSANNPTDPINPLSPFDTGPNLNLNAGGVQNLLSLPLTPIASVVIDGTLNANDAAIILRGNAIEALDSTLIAGSIQVDVRDAPANGAALSDDDGLLTGPCLEGFACLGDMDAINRIEIGQNSNNDLIGLFIEQATISATDILITTRNDIVMGTNNIDTELTATGTFSATSITGDVNLRDAVIGADQILIDAAGSLLGNGELSSDNDIGIDVGNSIIIGGIITGGELTNVANVGGPIEGSYFVNGDFVAGFFSQGSTSIDLSAGGSIDITGADTPDSIFLNAGDDAFLGQANAPGDIDIVGSSIGFNELVAGGSIFLDAAIGSVSAGQFSLLSAGRDVDVFAAGDISIGDVDAVDTVTIDGSAVAVSAVTANQIDLTSGSDILFDLLQSASAITLDAVNGRIAANNGSGDIVSDGDVTLDALDIAIINVTSLGSVTANATAGDASFGVVDAANDITITASGSPSVLNAISGGNTSITGSSIIFNNGTIGGDLTLDATGGDIDGNGAVSVGGAIDFAATGDIGFGSLDAQGGSFVVVAGGDIAFVNATSTDFIDLAANGAVQGGDINAANAVSVDANRIAVGDVLADQINLTSATDILFDLIQSPNAVSLTASNGRIGVNTGPGDIISDADVTLIAQAIDINQIDAGGDVDATATAGALTVETIVSGGAIALAAANGAVNVGDLDAASNIAIDGAGVVTGDLLARGDSGDGDIGITSGTGVTIGNGSAAGAFSAMGEEIDFTTIDAGTDVSLTANSGALNGTQISAGGTADLNAGTGGITLDMLTASDANLAANGGAIVLDDAVIGGLLFATGASIDIASSTDLTVDVTATDGDVSVQSDGNLDVQSAIANGEVGLSSINGSTTVAAASGENIILISADGLSITDDVDAQSALSIDAGGTFTLSGTATAQTIEIMSTDVDITADGVLGDATRTNSIAFIAPDEIYLGGAGGNGASFEIDNAEFSRIHSAGDIDMISLGQGAGGTGGGGGGPVVIAPAGSITVDTLDVIAGDGSSATGQNIGQGGRLSLESEADINIIGDATITGATGDTEFFANANDLVRLNTATGGLFVLDANGGLAGQITIFATDFIAATDAAFADIQGMSVADVDLRLGDSDGVDRPDGVIRADTLEVLTTASQVFIQNTAIGTDFADRRGFDVNTLLIDSDASAGSFQPIVINGLIAGVPGIDTIPLADIGSVIDTSSTINGCLIVDPASCGQTTPPPPPTGGPVTPTPPTGGPLTPTPIEPDDSLEVETRDLIDDGLDPSEVLQPGALEAGLINIEPNQEFGTDPLIDDPVTGAGNEDLWVSDEEECVDDDSCALEPAE